MARTEPPPANESPARTTWEAAAATSQLTGCATHSLELFGKIPPTATRNSRPRVHGRCGPFDDGRP